MNFQAIGALISAVSLPLFVVGLLMLIIQAIRKKKKKSALVVIVLSVVLLVGGFGVTLIGDADIFPKNIKGEAKDYAEQLVIAEYNPVTHNNVKSVDVKFTSDDVDGNEYTFYGKVTVIDQHSDKYIGNFTIMITHNKANGFTAKTVDIETPRKK